MMIVFYICILLLFFIIIMVMFNYLRYLNRLMVSCSDDKEKYYRMYLLSARWDLRSKKGYKIADQLKNYGVKEIAIYGMDYLGLTLLEELKDSDILVKYGIDINANGIFCRVKMIKPDEIFDDVDAIIVTAISSFDSIYKMLSEKCDYRIISIEEIVYAR